MQHLYTTANPWSITKMPPTRSTPNRNLSGCTPSLPPTVPSDTQILEDGSPEQTRAVVMQLNFPSNLSNQAIQRLSSSTPQLLQETLNNIGICPTKNLPQPANTPSLSGSGFHLNNPSLVDHSARTPPIDHNKGNAVNQIKAQLLASDILHAYNVHTSTIDAFVKLFDGETITKKDLRSMAAEIRYVRDNREYRDELEYDSPTPEKKKPGKRGRSGARNSRFNIDI